MPPSISSNAMWSDDAELIEIMQGRLFTGVVGDILDEMGFRHQFLPPEIRPLDPGMKLAGRAMPVLEADVFCEPEQPFGLMFEALDDLKEGEVYVVGGGSGRFAVWGELMTVAALNRGARGVLADGYVRDTLGILKLGFPVYARGSFAQDQRWRGRVIDFRTVIEIGGVSINPGDLLLGDVDGVLVIPQAAEEEVVRRSLEKIEREDAVRRALERGMSASEAFRRYGVM